MLIIIDKMCCKAFSIPSPDTIHWTFYGFPVDTSSPHYSLMENILSDGIASTLVIKESVEKDFGDYNCSVKNSHGKDSLTITLKQSG